MGGRVPYRGGGILQKRKRKSLRKEFVMAGLKEWFKQDWVDIGAKKKGGGFKKCGRKSASGSKRKYPKCVPAAKAARMTDSQRRSAVARKRSKPQGVGGKPTNVSATFAKRKKAMMGGFMGRRMGIR